jgi:hypothetical protein
MRISNKQEDFDPQYISLETKSWGHIGCTEYGHQRRAEWLPILLHVNESPGSKISYRQLFSLRVIGLTTVFDCATEESFPSVFLPLFYLL